jgi:hypothetical protein
MKIDARLTLNKVRFDADTDAHLVLSLTAPEVNADKVRPKLALIMCIDTSTSMSENRKLEYAKQSVFKMIEHLKGDDIFGVVSFDSTVHVVAKPVRLEGKKDEMRAAVAKLETNGMTNFSGGMLKSLELLNALDLSGDYLHRVIMFTDGVANVGPAKEAGDIIKMLQANMGHVTVSAFGYGTGTQDFKPDFLTEFAKEGKGNYAHVENPDKALQAFGTELGGLISTYATDLVLEIKPLNGHSVEKVISDVDVDEEVTGEVFVKLPDLLAEEVRHIVVGVKLAKQKAHGPRAVNVFEVSAKYLTFDSTGKKETHTEDIKSKVQFVKEGEEDGKADAKLDDIVGLAQLVRAQLEAETHAKKGNFVQAQSVMRNATSDLHTRGRVNLAAASARLGDNMKSASMYAEKQGYLRSFERGATRGVGVASYAGSAGEDLNFLGVVTSNSTQTSTSAAFTGAVVTTTTTAAPIGAGPISGASWMVPPPAPGVVATSGYLHVDPTAPLPSSSILVEGVPLVDLLAAVPAPVPTHEVKQADDSTSSKSSRKPLKQSRKSW